MTPPFGNFPKIHPFLRRQASLILQMKMFNIFNICFDTLQKPQVLPLLLWAAPLLFANTFNICLTIEKIKLNVKVLPLLLWAAPRPPARASAVSTGQLHHHHNHQNHHHYHHHHQHQNQHHNRHHLPGR